METTLEEDLQVFVTIQDQEVSIIYHNGWEKAIQDLKPFFTKSSSPYIKDKDGRRFEVLKTLLGFVGCQSCLMHLGAKDIDSHVCDMWWLGDETSSGYTDL